MSIFSSCFSSDVRPPVSNETKNPKTPGHKSGSGGVTIIVTPSCSQGAGTRNLYFRSSLPSLSPTIAFPRTSSSDNVSGIGSLLATPRSSKSGNSCSFSVTSSSSTATGTLRVASAFATIVEENSNEGKTQSLSSGAYPQIDRSLDKLNRIRSVIEQNPEEGYQSLATWLTNGVFGPKGRMTPLSAESKMKEAKMPTAVPCFHYQKIIIDAIEDTEISHLSRISKIQDNLTLQQNIQALFARRVIGQLMQSNKELGYQVLAQLIGKKELPAYPCFQYGPLSNLSEAQQEWGEILDDHTIKQVVRNIDSIETLDLSVPCAGKLLHAAIETYPDKALALLCRSLSNLTVGPDIEFGYEQVVRPIAESLVGPIADGFMAHLADANKPPMTMAIHHPLWSNVHTYLKTAITPLAEVDPAMEWFIAAINVRTAYDKKNDFFFWLKHAGYSLDDLTASVRSKITHLLLNQDARAQIQTARTEVCRDVLCDFIATFQNLQSLNLEDKKIKNLPDNCNAVRKLVLSTPELMGLQPMPDLEDLYMYDPHSASTKKYRYHDTHPLLPESFPALRSFSLQGSYQNLPKMPLLTFLHMEGDNCLPQTSTHLKQLMVQNNRFLREISGNFQLELLYLYRCPSLRKLFIAPKDIPEKLSVVQPRLHYLYVYGSNAQIENSCKDWKNLVMHNPIDV